MEPRIHSISELATQSVRVWKVRLTLETVVSALLQHIFPFHCCLKRKTICFLKKPLEDEKQIFIVSPVGDNLLLKETVGG